MPEKKTSERELKRKILAYGEKLVERVTIRVPVTLTNLAVSGSVQPKSFPEAERYGTDRGAIPRSRGERTDVISEFRNVL